MPADGDSARNDSMAAGPPAFSESLQTVWPVILSWVLVLLPIGGWIVAQSLTSRIAHSNEYTSALIHTLAASVFAVILELSAVTNATIVTFRFRDRPKSFGFRWFPMGLVVVVALAAAWLVCLVVGNSAQPVEFWIALALALASVYVFIQILRRDKASTVARRERVSARRDARSPENRRRVRVVRWLVPLAAIALLVGAGIVLEIVPMVHGGCHIEEYGSENGNYSMTTNCGSFAVLSNAASKRAASTAFYSAHVVTITTRGYEFGFPPAGIVTQITSTR